MKRLVNNIVLFFLFAKSFSQINLVPNYSFEDTISCPQVQGLTFYSYTPPWFSPNLNTPDIYNVVLTQSKWVFQIIVVMVIKKHIQV
jgi:hypothetical protein